MSNGGIKVSLLFQFADSKLIVSRKVLMLGSGFVTRPTLDILSDAGIKVSVGT
jgi:hypothetical protein